MPITLSKPAHSIGPGYLLIAAIGSTEPANTVAGSVFTDAWPAAWILLGATAEGSVFSYQLNAEPIDAAEFFDPLGYETESRAGKLDAALLSISARSFAAAFNGGSNVVSGTGATTKTVYTPPAPGSEVRKMLGWESRDGTERMIARQVFQSGEATINRGKGAGNKSTIPVSYMFEVPDTGAEIWNHYFAGTARGI